MVKAKVNDTIWYEKSQVMDKRYGNGGKCLFWHQTTNTSKKRENGGRWWKGPGLVATAIAETLDGNGGGGDDQTNTGNTQNLHIHTKAVTRSSERREGRSL